MDPEAKNGRLFFLLFVPLAWAVCSRVHFHFPGDEYAMWVISGIAGTWPLFFVRVSDIHEGWIPWLAAGTGAAVMAALGGLSVWLRVSARWWLIVWAAAGSALLIHSVCAYPSVERMLAKNGSWWAYILSSALIGMYAASASVLAITPLWWGWRRRRARRGGGGVAA